MKPPPIMGTLQWLTAHYWYLYGAMGGVPRPCPMGPHDGPPEENFARPACSGRGG
jgi:hypothetical protein